MVDQLLISNPNVGGGEVDYVHCPNCSMMYATKDDKGYDEQLPANCKRCSCPVVAGEVSQKWMNQYATENHDAKLVEIGRRVRGGQLGGADDGGEMSSLRAEVAELKEALAELAKAKK